MVCYILMVGVRVDPVKFGTSNLQLNQPVLYRFPAGVTDSHLGLDGEVRVVGIGHSLHLVVGNMHLWTHPQLHFAEDSR